MRRWHFILAVLFVAATPAGAQQIPAISLVPGESVTVRLDDSGRAGAPERGRAEWTRFDVYAAQHLSRLPVPDAPVPEGTPFGAPESLSPEPIPESEIRVRFLTIADRHAMLVVENGQGRALAYRARMTLNGRSRHTDVCVVLPLLPSYEHWPHLIERIELTDFRFIPWVTGRAPTCE